MENQSRIYNSIKNFLFGFGNQIIVSLLTFLSRMVFVRQMGLEYLGINGLFTSILSVLSLAELGFGNIVIFSLYKPLAENDNDAICALIKFYRTIYIKIAVIIAAVGLALIPILGRIVKTDEEIELLTVYYILFLLNTVVSYLYVYKTSLIKADQKQYIISKYTMIMQIIMTGVQILILVFLHNYILYLCIQVLCTFFTNYFLSLKVNKLYPFLMKPCKRLSKNAKTRIFRDVKAMFSYKIGGIIINSTDNIFISAMVNTISVGIYSNYTLVISFVNQFINMIYDALYSSVGNLNSKGNVDQQKEIFDVLVLCFSWIACVCFVCLYQLLNPFIQMVFNIDSVFSNITIIAICINFYLPIILYPIWMYRNTTGLFKETKNILLYTAVLNFALSLIMGRRWGITGILSATFISRLLSSFWFEPFILYRNGFEKSSKEYFFKQLQFAIVIVVSIVFTSVCIMKLPSQGFVILLLKGIICFLSTNIFLLITMHKTKAYKYLKNLVKYRSKACS